MRFSFCQRAGEKSLVLGVKEYAHIFKVRRVTVGTELDFANLDDGSVYAYEIDRIDKKEATLTLQSKIEVKSRACCKLHVGWCIVDPKTIEKHLCMLNEMGVEKISFVYADFSQRSYKVDEKRLKRILINSCEQSGRMSLMELEIVQSVEEFLVRYPQSVIIDFSENILSCDEVIESFLVGPEGGFSEAEREQFMQKSVFGLKSCNILRSETAVVGVCAKMMI